MAAAYTKTPLVSVIIPTYNREGLVVRAVRSVLRQTFRDFEIIVVDDGSSDNTAAVLRRLSSDLTIIRHKTNLGASKARDTGVDSAQGQYAAFLDSDDEWLPEKLRYQIHDVLSQPDPENYLCYCKKRVITPHGNHIEPRRGMYEHESFPLYLLGPGTGAVQCSTLFLPTPLAAAVRFDEESETREDTDFCLRLWHHGVRFIFVDKVLSIYYEDNRRDRTSNRQSFENLEKWLKKNEKIFPKQYIMTRLARNSGDITGKGKWRRIFQIIGPAAARGWISPLHVGKAVVWGVVPSRCHEVIRRLWRLLIGLTGIQRHR